MYHAQYRLHDPRNGTVSATSSKKEPNTQHTEITVTSPEFHNIHVNRHKWFLDLNFVGASLTKTSELEIYAAPANGIFYRGIQVYPTKTLHTYNFLRNIDLTEDRVLKDPWTAAYILGITFISSDNKELISSVVQSTEESWESRSIPFVSIFWAKPSTTFIETVGELKQAGAFLRKDVVQMYFRHIPPAKISPINLRPVEAAMLERALKALATLNITTHSIIVVESLGENVLGEVKNNQIYIARKAFQMGTKVLAGTILEEWIHTTHNYLDCSRSMQNYLIDLIMTLCEELHGEPI